MMILERDVFDVERFCTCCSRDSKSIESVTTTDLDLGETIETNSLKINSSEVEFSF